MQIESMSFLEISSESEILNSHKACPIVIRQQLRIQIKIFDYCKDRLITIILVLILLKFSDISVDLLVVSSTSQIKKWIEKRFAFVRLLFYLDITRDSYGCLTYILEFLKIRLFGDRNSRFLGNDVCSFFFGECSIIFDILLLNIHLLYEGQLLILDHKDCIFSIFHELRLFFNFTKEISGK